MTHETLKLALEMVQTKMYAHAEMYLKEALAQPAQRTWVRLTEEDRQHLDEEQLGWNDLLTATDALLKEKNT